MIYDSASRNLAARPDGPGMLGPVEGHRREPLGRGVGSLDRPGRAGAGDRPRFAGGVAGASTLREQLLGSGGPGGGQGAPGLDERRQANRHDNGAAITWPAAPQAAASLALVGPKTPKPGPPHRGPGRFDLYQDGGPAGNNGQTVAPESTL